MFVWRRSIGLIGLLGWLLYSSEATLPAPLAREKDTGVAPTIESVLANLPDGAYQFCTEPDPKDWRDGVGACLNFMKQGITADGYYGYPHSGNFICLRGEVSEDWLHGEGLLFAWGGQIWSTIPQEESTWDQEGRLHLNQGVVVRSEGMGEDPVIWIVFRQARLNMEGLYRYPESRMTSSTQLCDWPSDLS